VIAAEFRGKVHRYDPVRIFLRKGCLLYEFEGMKVPIYSVTIATNHFSGYVVNSVHKIMTLCKGSGTGYTR
jgi:hypothetical protein